MQVDFNKLTPKQRRAWEDWQDACKRVGDREGPAANETAEQKAARIKRLLKPQNFYEFCRYYFPNYASAPFGWFHKEAIQDVLINRNPNNIWEWHRESAKSVFADILIPTYLLVTGWLNGVILGSQNQEKACKLIGDIEAELRRNKRLIADFGDFGVSGSWLSGYFSTAKGIGFWAFGRGQSPAGAREGHRRPNLGIIDDIDSKDLAKNPKRVEESVDWILGEFAGCLETKGSIFLYVNNRIHKAGITAHIAGDVEPGDPLRQGYKRIKVYLTEDPATHQMLTIEQGGVPAWRENFTVEDCQAKITRMGPRNALRQLYHQHVEEGKFFRDEDLPWVLPLPLSAYDDLITYCDPAYGDSGKGCYRAIVLIGRQGLNYDVLYAWLSQNGNLAAAHYQLADWVQNDPRRFYDKGPSRIVLPDSGVAFKPKVTCDHHVESNELQRQILRMLYQVENEARGTAWYPRFDMRKKGDKLTRIEALQPLAEHGHIRFSSAQRANKDMVTLRDQFIGFPDGFVDGPDAVEGALSLLAARVRKSTSHIRQGTYARNAARLG